MMANGAVSRQWMAVCIFGAVAIGAVTGSPADSLALTCLDQATRTPVAGARVAATVDTTLTYYVTDAQGHCEIPLPEGGPRSLVALSLNAEQYVPVVVEWRVGARPVPAGHTVFLEPGTTIGGTVLNAREEPVPNTSVRITLPVTESNGKQVLLRDHVERTGEDGTWRCGIVPANVAVVQLRVEAPTLSVQQNFRYGDGGRPIEPLRDLSDRLVLEDRCVVYGGVIGTDGKPIGGANVAVWLADSSWRTARLATTDAWGRFRVTGCPPGKSTLLVRAHGWAPLLEHGDIARQQPGRTFALERGCPLRVRVVDAAGEPLPGAWLSVEAWRGIEGLLDWQAFADEEGEALWEHAPAEGLSLVAEAAGAEPGTIKIPRVKDEIYTIRIGSAVRVRGRVLEEDSDRPVTVFEVTPGIRPENVATIRWLSSRRFEGAGGAFSFSLPRDAKIANFIKITAPGRAPWISAEIPFGRDDFELTARLSEAAPLKGRALDEQGRPVPGASVYLCTHSDGLYFRNGVLAGEFLGPAAETGPDGSFELSPELPPYSIVVIAEHGCAFCTSDDWTTGKAVDIQPWSTLRGRVRSGDAAVPHQSFRMALYVEDRDIPVPLFEYQGKTTEQGDFEAGKIPPMRCRAVFDFVLPDGLAFQWPTETLALQPGSSVETLVGGMGQVVTGTVPLPEETAATPVFAIMCTIQRTPAQPGSREPVYQARTPLGPDGTFLFPDVPAGSYVASVAVPRVASAEDESSAVDRLELAFEVPAREDGTPPEVVDLGDMASLPKVTLAAGEALPGFDAYLLDETPVSLADYAGRFVLVDVWATWCGPCFKEIPHLKKIYAQFGDDPRFAMLGISLDSSKDELTACIARENILWPQIYAGEVPGLDIPLIWGIDAIPAILLIGPDGTLVAQHLRGEAIGVAVRQALQFSGETEGGSDE